MAVHLTRIYTRTGDDGTTGALGNPRQQITDVLRQIQNDLFDAGADLSTPVVENPKHPPLRITQSYIDRLEAWCDEFNESLPPLKSFVLPGGSALSALLHVPERWRDALSVRRGTRSRSTRQMSVRYPQSI